MKMAIPESQLKTWSHQGSVTQSSNTFQAIRRALIDSDTGYADKSFEVFLQGSYRNSTNIHAESDVDIVIRLDSIFRSNIADLSPEEQQAYHATFPNSTYSFLSFRDGVYASLVDRFGGDAVKAGNKAIKIKAEGQRRNADVVVCYQYRYYKKFDPSHKDDCAFGIIIPTNTGEIINYPKQHSENLTLQHQSTNQMLKPMVRVLKNMRSSMVDNSMLQDGVAPSYYLEGLFYNVPADQYVSTSFGDTFCNGINWVLQTDCRKLVCANWQYYLLGNQNVQWNEANFNKFLAAACKLWKEW
jgi:hypothetical protein